MDCKTHCRSEWGSRKNQERTLGIWLKRDSFDRILSEAVHSTFVPEVYHFVNDWNKAVAHSNVRLQWDPDHHPNGAKHPRRRAIQLGLRNIESFVEGNDILLIQDLSDFVASQYPAFKSRDTTELITPLEEVYPVKDPVVAKRLGISEVLS